MNVRALHDALALLFALLTALANALAVMSQHMASTMSVAPEPWWRLVWRLVRHPLWLLGWLALGGSLLFQALALHFGTLSLVQPVLVIELVAALALRRWWLGQALDAAAWWAAVVTTSALGLFLLIVTSTSHQRVGSEQWWPPVLACSGGVVALAVAGRRGSRLRRATCWGSATAVAWALEAAFIKEATRSLTRWGVTSVWHHWPVYAFVGCGVVGLLAEQTALHSGPLRASQSAIVILDPLVSVALGVWIFGDRLSPSWSTGLVAGASLVVMSIGAWRLVAATPEFTGRTSP